ncbi:MAG: hypothetical protein AAFR68_06120 [Pseudomonadota bacterium]
MTVLAILWSLCCLACLSRYDPKRRRALGYPPAPVAGDARLVWGLAVVPGVLLCFAGMWASFVMWLGASTTLGWAWVAVPDHRIDALWQRVLRRIGL